MYMDNHIPSQSTAALAEFQSVQCNDIWLRYLPQVWRLIKTVIISLLLNPAVEYNTHNVLLTIHINASNVLLKLSNMVCFVSYKSYLSSNLVFVMVSAMLYCVGTCCNSNFKLGLMAACEIGLELNHYSVCGMDNNRIHLDPWDVNIHPCPNFNFGLANQSLKLCHGWVITFHVKQWVLSIH